MDSLQITNQNESKILEGKIYVTHISAKSPTSDRVIELDAVATKLINHKGDVTLAVDKMIEDGYDLHSLIQNKNQIPSYINAAKKTANLYRVNLEERIRSNGTLSYIHIDSDKYSSPEITERIRYGLLQIEAVEKWELQSLDKFVSTIDGLLESFAPTKIRCRMFY